MMDTTQATKANLIARWAKITVIEWQLAIAKKKIGQTHELWNSFEDHVLMTYGGDIEKILFIYKYYGAMVDMGVGKGTPLGGKPANATARKLEGKRVGARRRRKPWLNKITARETNRLAELLQQHYGDMAMLTFSDRNEKGSKNSIGEFDGGQLQTKIDLKL